MNKNRILEEAKMDLSSIISNLSFETFNESELHIKKYLEIISALSELPDNFLSYDLSEPTTTTGIKEIYDAKNNIFLGQIHLNLSGANIGSFKIFIPEKYVRKLDIEEGDWVKASVIRNPHDQKPVYEYELIEKVAAASNKTVLKYSVVEFDETINQFYILSNPYDLLSQKILLDQYKIGNFHLQAGDIVDYAYWNEDFLNGKIIWIYQTESENSAIDSCEKNIVSISDKLSNITVGVIGLEEKKDQFQKSVISNGGNFFYLSGNESVDELSLEIKKADVIIIFIDSVGHDGMFKIRNVSKEFDTPILYSKSVDSETLITMIIEELEN